MTEAIIVALITALGSLGGSWLMYRKGEKEIEVKNAVREQQQTDRLASIEHKLDVHNGYAEKLGDITISIVEMRKDIQYLKEKH